MGFNAVIFKTFNKIRHIILTFLLPTVYGRHTDCKIIHETHTFELIIYTIEVTLVYVDLHNEFVIFDTHHSVLSGSLRSTPSNSKLKSTVNNS